MIIIIDNQGRAGLGRGRVGCASQQRGAAFPTDLVEGEGGRMHFGGSIFGSWGILGQERGSLRAPELERLGYRRTRAGPWEGTWPAGRGFGRKGVTRGIPRAQGSLLGESPARVGRDSVVVPNGGGHQEDPGSPLWPCPGCRLLGLCPGPGSRSRLFY